MAPGFSTCGKCWCWLEVDAEDSLVTVKAQHLSLCFSEIVGRLSKGQGPFNRLLAVATKRFLPQYFSKQISQKFSKSIIA